MTLQEFVVYIVEHPDECFCDGPCPDGIKGSKIVAVNTSLGFSYFRHVHRLKGLEVWVKAPGSVNGLYKDVEDRKDKLVVIKNGPSPQGWLPYPKKGIQVDEGILKLDAKETACVFEAKDGTTINFHMAYLA